MSIQDRRTARGWTQEQLAGHSGLSVRTIQRLEKGQAATLESLKCLAAVLETSVSTLMQEQDMTAASPDATAPARPDRDERNAIAYVHNLKWLLIHAMICAVMLPALLVLNLAISPSALWILWTAGGWLLGLALHMLVVFMMFGLLGPAWEQRQFRRRMNGGRGL